MSICPHVGHGLHARLGVAPLKPVRFEGLSADEVCLHARLGVAPLKHTTVVSGSWYLHESPRPFGRGPIEATLCLLRTCCLAACLHARLGVAPLKPANIMGVADGLGRLHARLGVDPFDIINTAKSALANSPSIEMCYVELVAQRFWRLRERRWNLPQATSLWPCKPCIGQMGHD